MKLDFGKGAIYYGLKDGEMNKLGEGTPYVEEYVEEESFTLTKEMIAESNEVKIESECKLDKKIIESLFPDTIYFENFLYKFIYFKLLQLYNGDDKCRIRRYKP